MKKLAAFFLTLTVLSGCSIFNKSTKPHQKYLPGEFSGLYFGMPLEDFLRIKQDEDFDVTNIMDFRISYTESNLTDEIPEVTYYFDNENNKPLYELIIVYQSESKRDKIAKSLLGEPNSGNEWVFDTGDVF